MYFCFEWHFSFFLLCIFTSCMGFLLRDKWKTSFFRASSCRLASILSHRSKNTSHCAKGTSFCSTCSNPIRTQRELSTAFYARIMANARPPPNVPRVRNVKRLGVNVWWFLAFSESHSALLWEQSRAIHLQTKATDRGAGSLWSDVPWVHALSRSFRFMWQSCLCWIHDRKTARWTINELAALQKFSPRISFVFSKCHFKNRSGLFYCAVCLTLSYLS